MDWADGSWGDCCNIFPRPLPGIIPYSHFATRNQKLFIKRQILKICLFFCFVSGFFVAIGISMMIGGINMSGSVAVDSMSASNWANMGKPTVLFQVRRWELINIDSNNKLEGRDVEV